MKVYQDEETGYLMVEDISRGVRLLPEQKYQEIIHEIGALHREVTSLKSRVAEKDAKIVAERRKMEDITILCNKVIAQMSKIKVAYYWQGFCNGAWSRNTEEAREHYKDLLDAVKDFPKTMQDVLHQIKNL